MSDRNLFNCVKLRSENTIIAPKYLLQYLLTLVRFMQYMLIETGL